MSVVQQLGMFISLASIVWSIAWVTVTKIKACKIESPQKIVNNTIYPIKEKTMIPEKAMEITPENKGYEIIKSINNEGYSTENYKNNW